MLSIKDQEYLLALVEIELARISDKASDPSTSPDDLAHHTRPAVAKLRARVASSIASSIAPAPIGSAVCEDEIVITLRRVTSAEIEHVVVGPTSSGLHVEHRPQRVTCTLAVSRRGQGGDVVPISDSDVIRDAIDQFRRRADEVGAEGDRVDAQSGWTW